MTNSEMIRCATVLLVVSSAVFAQQKPTDWRQAVRVMQAAEPQFPSGEFCVIYDVSDFNRPADMMDLLDSMAGRKGGRVNQNLLLTTTSQRHEEIQQTLNNWRDAGAGDLNHDGSVDAADVAIGLEHFGSNYCPSTGPGDTNLDGIVDQADLLRVLEALGKRSE